MRIAGLDFETANPADGSICAVGCIFAGLTEIVQGSLPYRYQDIKDFGADCLAIGIASLLVFIVDLSKMRKKS